jgi:recombination associated protein RdgC
MWFKNLHIYRIPNDFALTADELAEKLEQKRFTPLARQSDKTLGWISPIHRNKEYLVHAAGGCFLFSMRKEQKVIPASTIKEALEEKVFALEEEFGRKVYRKEKLSIKEDLVSTMLPNAFSRSSHISAYFDTLRNLLVINASSPAQVDEFYDLLTESIGSFGALPIVADENPAEIMSRWVKQSPPKGWSLSGEYQLKDHTDERSARFKDYDAENPFVIDLLDDGYSIHRLGVRYKEQLSALIQDDLQIKSVKFSDELLKDNDELKGENELVKFDADFALMTSSIASFTNEIFELFLKTNEN